MEHLVKAPTVGESITEVRILKWLKENGQAVKNGDILLEIETDKASVEVAAEADGALEIVAAEGATVNIGAVVAKIDDSKTGSAQATASTPMVPKGEAPRNEHHEIPPAGAGGNASGGAGNQEMSPAVRKIATEKNIDVSTVAGSGKDGRVTKGDLLDARSSGAPGGATGSSAPGGAALAPSAAPTAPTPQAAGSAHTSYPAKSAPASTYQDQPGDRRIPMTRIRARIAERLVEAQHTAAILTTFNEVDMKPVMDVRAQHKDAFKAKHGVPLSFMSFFTRACVMALKEIPSVNGTIDGKDVILRDYVDIGVAVGTERGLVVPVMRGAEKMSFVDIERSIGELAKKARDRKLSIADMAGGTFTISNGGTYGSMMSTPILNPPQSGILGMHAIKERPVVIDGKIEIRPMMYLALSYDHRMIDGKEAVTFLVQVRDLLEKPERLGLDFI